ncbi:hypothetical protein I0C86_10865 [Plantactinospora sp. S1510]|uniref:Guanylate cyclase domain-containing protein n=1 Tax=Plantactinospora alkalitolerans TaxID=2789879 RepID=A0ABS0GTP8_9ACTN|nr:hypothetical protein [Plantactinospora alkalitolerans]MBF9129466.1 hypothetical protein [Plantactinospora alkalitolerans]
MNRNTDFSRRLLISVDAKGYGGHTDRRQAAVQEGLLAVLDVAARRAGLHRAGWERQPAGDGELSVLPSTEQEPRVLDDFVRELHSALVSYNEDLVRQAQLRLRLALHFGAAMPAGNGFSGQGVVQVSRLVDSEPVRAILADERIPLAVVISDRLFTDVVAQGHTSLRPGDFRPINVNHKEYGRRAWLRSPGFDIHALDLAGAERPRTHEPASDPVSGGTTATTPGTGTSGADAADPGPSRAAAPPSTVHTEFHDRVRAENFTIVRNS